jgi:hypothetical protein
MKALSKFVGSKAGPYIPIVSRRSDRTPALLSFGTALFLLLWPVEEFKLIDAQRNRLGIPEVQ